MPNGSKAYDILPSANRREIPMPLAATRQVLFAAAFLVAAPMLLAQTTGNRSVVSDRPQTAADSLPRLTAIPRDAELRVFLANGQVVHGKLASYTADSALFQSGAGDRFVTVPVDSIQAIDGKLNGDQQRRRTMTGLGLGLLGGAMAGGLIGAAMPIDRPPPPTCESEELCLDFDFSELDRAGNILGGALLGSLVGGIVGTMIGRASGDNWQRIHGPRDLTFSPVWTPNGSVGFHASVTLQRIR